MSAHRSIKGAAVFLLGFVVVIVFGQAVFPALTGQGAEPLGIYGRGLVVGLLSALLAMGLVLVYRTNRIINFAQGGLGGYAATLASELYQVFHWPYAAAVLAGVGATVLTSMFIEFAVIRRFHRAPRLILTVATIGVAQILGAIELIIPAVVHRDRDVTEFRTTLTSPFDAQVFVGGVNFSGDHIVVLLLAPAVIIGLFAFLRYTRYGIAARGVAENRDRARLLGVKVSRVSLLVWALAGLLSALTATLSAPIVGFTFGAIGGVGLLFRALAAAVIGRMTSLPITAGAAVLLYIAEATVEWYYGPGPAHGFLLVVVVVALLAQRHQLGRVDPESSSWQAVAEIRPIPVQLRAFPEVRWGTRGAGLALASLFVLLPFILAPSRTQLLAVIMIFGMVGISLVVLTGWSGNISLGHWAIVGFGALVAGKLGTMAEPQDFFLALLVGSLAGAGVSVIIGLPALRIRGLFLGVTTLALAVASAEFVFQWEFFRIDDPIRRPVIFGLWDVTSQHAFYYVCLIALVVTLVAGRNLRRSRLGRVLVALRDNETAAQSYGVRPVRMKLMAFGISGFIAAFAGGMYAYHQVTLGAGRFPAERSLLIFSMVVIGGMGSMTGAILGAAYVNGVLFFLPGEFQLLATGFGMLILLLIFPGGLGQIVFAWRDRYLRWVADRRGVIVPSLVADRRDEEASPSATAPPPIVASDTEDALVAAREVP